jgi:hypothetical protein
MTLGMKSWETGLLAEDHVYIDVAISRSSDLCMQPWTLS